LNSLAALQSPVQSFHLLVVVLERVGVHRVATARRRERYELADDIVVGVVARRGLGVLGHYFVYLGRVQVLLLGFIRACLQMY